MVNRSRLVNPTIRFCLLDNTCRGDYIPRGQGGMALDGNLGSRLKGQRDRLGESLQRVADAIGASKAHVWEIESGRAQNPSVNLVRRLASHFGVTVGWLLGEQPDLDGPDQRAAVLYAAARDLPDDDFTLLKSIVETMRKRRSSAL
jgi:transcriptional regulator with XRE-family HTH domain